MKYMLIVLITLGSPIIGEDKKTLELRIPQESKQECEKSAQTFKFYLQPILSIATALIILNYL